MKVAVVSEFYPRAHDPVLGLWAHRQALAARDAGADVRVLVLHRPIPPRATALRDAPRALRTLAAQPRRATLDGIEVEYVPFVSPPRPRSYGSWGAWAAPSLAVALRRLRARFAFDLVHAHNAVPAADAVLRARIGAPLVVSVHGADVLFTAPRHPAGERAVRRAYGAARLVLANSAGMQEAAAALGALHTRVVRLGADVPEPPPTGKAPDPTLVTVAHLVARKRHADVVRALWLLRDRHPTLRYLVVGDGPEREPLARLATELGVADRVELAGQLPNEQALARAHEAHLFVMPSVDEAFGVVYVEAMAAGLPVIAANGEPGPREIASAGGGIRLVAPGDVEALAAEIDALLSEPGWALELGAQGRATVQAAFTWRACGQATVAAYEEALR
ncbi:MAG: teichuronic acid biosynthesis glycosyltransferase TuaC [Solirubrobacteraceae bacterium]|nr:teichuronic acid biosynthesis glycosyltransferase TuaC [Solirubrobacteraceae bacterium]